MTIDDIDYSDFNADVLKQSLESKDYKQSALIISTLYITSPNKFRNTVLLSGCLPDPLDFNFEKGRKLLVFLSGRVT